MRAAKFMTRSFLALALVALCTYPALAEPQQPAGEDCAAIQAWVEANKDRLPTTYDGLSRFSVTYRRAIFDALPAAIQSALWRQHFDTYLASHPNLTAAQVAIVREMHAQASPAFFARRSEGAAQGSAAQRLRAEDDRRLAELETRAARLFPADELTALMAHLGPAAAETRRQDGDALPMGIACDCSTASDWCSAGYTCWRANCDVIPDACGTFWTHDCDGLCFRP